MKRRILIGSFSGLNFTIWTAKIDRTTQVSSCELAYVTYEAARNVGVR